jgi:hypothetical protein
MIDMTVPKTAGLCLIRDAVDIAPVLCGHYLRLGFERIHFVDDGSSDGTYEFLDLLSKKTTRITVERSLAPFKQAHTSTQAANALIEDGSRAIFPFDADEFWNVSARELHKISTCERLRVIGARWVNFVQSRHREYPQPMGLLSVRYRADPIPGVDMDEVVALKQPFVSIDQVRKVAFWTNTPVAINTGQHGLVDGPDEADEGTFELFHLPIRYRSELTKRALNYEPRRAPSRSDAVTSWQSHFHRQIVLDGKSEAVWRANSVDRRGRLDVYGTPRQLSKDLRLRNIFLLSAVYLYRRFRTLAI